MRYSTDQIKAAATLLADALRENVPDSDATVPEIVDAMYERRVTLVFDKDSGAVSGVLITTKSNVHLGGLHAPQVVSFVIAKDKIGHGAIVTRRLLTELADQEPTLTHILGGAYEEHPGAERMMQFFGGEVLPPQFGYTGPVGRKVYLIPIRPIRMGRT